MEVLIPKKKNPLSPTIGTLLPRLMQVFCSHPVFLFWLDMIQVPFCKNQNTSRTNKLKGRTCYVLWLNVLAYSTFFCKLLLWSSPQVWQYYSLLFARHSMIQFKPRHNISSMISNFSLVAVATNASLCCNRNRARKQQPHTFYFIFLVKNYVTFV